MSPTASWRSRATRRQATCSDRAMASPTSPSAPWLTVTGTGRHPLRGGHRALPSSRRHGERGQRDVQHIRRAPDRPATTRLSHCSSQRGGRPRRRRSRARGAREPSWARCASAKAGSTRPEHCSKVLERHSRSSASRPRSSTPHRRSRTCWLSRATGAGASDDHGAPRRRGGCGAPMSCWAGFTGSWVRASCCPPNGRRRRGLRSRPRRRGPLGRRHVRALNLVGLVAVAPHTQHDRRLEAMEARTSLHRLGVIGLPAPFESVQLEQ